MPAESPLVVGLSSSLSGALGSQSWGGLVVSAKSTAGVSTLVTRTSDGLGVGGGRFDGQVDYDAAAGKSEALWLDFGGPVDAATLRIGRLNTSEGGRAEIGAWRAYDAAGALVGQGLLDGRGKTATGSYTYDFAIDPAADFQRIELTARPYNNDITLGATGDSSDFTLAQVTYAKASAAPAPLPALIVTQSGGTTAATEGGAGDGITVALASQPTANVTVAVSGDADVTASVTSLVFTPQNWNVAQAVAVGAVNDSLVEGTETAKLTLDPSSSDGGYNALPNTLLNVTITDNDGGGTGSPPPGAVVVKVGADIQALVNANANGTVFWIEAGEHRLQSITPKAGQSFIGEDGAVLNGSRELTGFAASGSTWYVGGQTQEGARRLLDHADATRGGYPDAVFLDDKPLQPVATLQDVRPGTFFFDYAADRIYIGDNPSGHQVEAAVSDFAFKGSATGVTIQNLTIEKYATPAQFGTIGGATKTQDWLIKDNEVRLNYGVGIQAGTGSEVIDNYVHHNGQMGVGATGNGILYQGNEIASNGFWAGIDPYWEGGGSKFAWTQNLVVRDNHVHDNSGMGLWTDIDNIYTLYEGNRVENNSGSGISHEISYDAVIRNNTLVGNGFGFDVWLWGGAIQIQNSSNVEVYGNYVDMTNGGNGITLIQQNRGTGGYGPRVTEDNYVHDNIVVSRSGEGRSGAVADYNWAAMKAGGNVFDDNEYRVTSTAEDHFAYGGWYAWDAYRTQSGWDASGGIVLI
jgi:parallel beta-helix repeat protein